MESMKERGSSLIESMIALVIFLIASVAWLALETSLAQQSGQSHLISQAMHVGQTTIDNLRQIPFDQLVDSVDPLHFTSEGEFSTVVDDDFYEVNCTITENEDPVFKTVDLFVSWDVYGADFDNAIELTFVRSQ